MPRSGRARSPLRADAARLARDCQPLACHLPYLATQTDYADLHFAFADFSSS
jgi:hypothetical protein